MSTALLYGANGYTGRIIAALAAQYGVRLIAAGRNKEEVERVARDHGFEARIFALDDAAAIDRALADVAAVLHCAGPFIHTAAPMAAACVRNRVHYVDITGEIEVFELLHALDADAHAAGIMLAPGSGFDVVPSDCLAAHLKLLLPSATHLRLAIKGSGQLSRGTATTMIEHLDRGGMIRRDGKLTNVPPAWRTRTVDYGDDAGPQQTMTIPWGDVATAFYSTGIPNVEVYAAAPRALRVAARVSRWAKPLLSRQWLKNVLKRRARARRQGPDEAELAHGSSAVWGRASDDQGRAVEARVRGPNGYLLTAHAALLVTRNILAGRFSPGFQTPSAAFGADFVLDIPGVVRD